MNTFSQLAPFIQDFIYRNHWESLRAVQVAAADIIFNTDDNLLLAATTASGKTEAAFFPILTLFNDDPPATVGALYIAPLKALINDQFLRLNDLCEEAEIPVWHWHGDVSRSHKEKLVKHPSGILQITPESLEAMLMRRHPLIGRLFGDLRFIVIDEIHSLLRSDRGSQCICCIERLCRIARIHPRRIGLSATIGDPEGAGRYLSQGTGRRTAIPDIAGGGKVRWRLSMEHFYRQVKEKGVTPRKLTEVKDVPPSLPPDSGAAPLDRPTDTPPREADPAMGYIFANTKGRKCLVFANSREEAEVVTSTLRQYCADRREPDRFLIHHGNLSQALRESAEHDMRDDERDRTTVTTATLELGIDIGRLERAFQINAPFTVSSFLQRMGRTGRRGLPPEMWFVIREDEPESRADLPTTLPWEELQAIALVQLYREEHWVEPPRLDRFPYSLLYHQTLATLSSEGELTPAGLASRVLTLTPFHRISQDDYRILLRHMLNEEHIQRTETGTLVVGLKGEKVTASFRFYAVFQENEEYTVRSESLELGTIVAPPPVGDEIAIAGHVWVVDEVDYKRHLVYCTKVRGIVDAFFGLCPGDIHTRILERMRKVLTEESTYPYLQAGALRRLEEARHAARLAGLGEHALVRMGGRQWCLFPWLGTYLFLTLERVLRHLLNERLHIRGLRSVRPYFMTFTMDCANEAEFFRILAEALATPPDAMTLLGKKEIPLFEKYDEFVPPELVRKGFACGVLDLPGLRSWAIAMADRLDVHA